MAPRHISLRAVQEPWETEEQQEYDEEYDEEYYEEYDGKYDGEYDGKYDGEYDAEWDSNDATDGGWGPNGEWVVNSAGAEKASAVATEQPETEEPAPVSAEETPTDPDTLVAEETPTDPSTLVADDEASLPDEADRVANFDSLDADNTVEQEGQGDDGETFEQNEPVDPQVPQEGLKLTPEEQAIKDRAAWQMAVAERKERLREAQTAKNDRARKLFDIFQKGRQDEKLNTDKKVVAVKSGRFKSRINKRGIVGDLGKKVAGKVADLLAEKLAEKLASKKQREGTDKVSSEKSEEDGEDDAPSFYDPAFMDNLMEAIKGPNLPVMEGLPGITSYNEEAPTNPEDPRRIHRVLKVVLGRELFEELSNLPTDTYEAQDEAAREELLDKVLFAVKGNPATEKIKVELLEGLPGLGDCGLALPLRKPAAKPVDPCELAELCVPDIPCAAADLCRKARAHEADDDITPTSTIADNESDDGERKVSPILTLLRLFRAARVTPREPKQKFYEGLRGIGNRDVGEFEAYMADFNNACSFNMREVRKEVVGAPRKLSPNFKTVEHTITVAGATRKPQGNDEKEEGADDDSDGGEDEEGAEGESGDEVEHEHEDSQDLQEKSKESSANGKVGNATAINDSEATPASDKSTARHGNHYGWFPSTIYRRWVEPFQDDVPAVADASAAPAADMAPMEPVSSSTLGEADVDDLISETITVASLGPALPPSTTPKSIFGTRKSAATAAATGGITGESTPVITEAVSAAALTVPTSTDSIPSTGLSSKEREMTHKSMGKDALSWERKQRQRARRLKKQREARARTLRRLRFAKQLEAERARKAADRAASLKDIDYQPPTQPHHSKRAPPSPLEAHASARTGQGVKEEEQRWHAGEGRVSAADREEAAREIAKAAKLREAEKQNGVEEAAARARVAVQDDGGGNPYLDHSSYDPAQAHVEEAAGGARFPTYKSVGDAAPELKNFGVGVTILVWIAVMVMILRCQRRRRDRSANWARERGERGRKKRRSVEQEREKLDV